LPGASNFGTVVEEEKVCSRSSCDTDSLIGAGRERSAERRRRVLKLEPGENVRISADAIKATAAHLIQRRVTMNNDLRKSSGSIQTICSDDHLEGLDGQSSMTSCDGSPVSLLALVLFQVLDKFHLKRTAASVTVVFETCTANHSWTAYGSPNTSELSLDTAAAEQLDIHRSKFEV